MDSPGHTFRFRRSSCLKSPVTIRRVFRDGSRLASCGYSVHWLETRQDKVKQAPCSKRGTRLAFVASRRFGKAHMRNRVRRRLREAARLNRDFWPANMDVIFRATGHQVAQMEFAELAQTLRESLLQIAARRT